MIRIFDRHTEQGNFRDTNYTNFDTVGTIINPISAYITEELNGEYSYELTVPMIDTDDSWKAIQPYSIIKSSTGQLFQINKLKYETQNGVPCIKAYAPHIWYYLSDMHVVRYERNDWGYWHVDHIMTDPFDIANKSGTRWSEGPTSYSFTYEVGVEAKVTHLKFEHVSIAYALLGSPDSVINTYNGYLYRDNFYFSIDSKLKHSRENAFYLDAADNCSEIKLTHDYQERITFLAGWDQFGNYVQYGGGADIAHGIIYGVEYAMTDDCGGNIDAQAENLAKMVVDHMNGYYLPKKTYEVTFVDSYNTVRDEGWERLRLLKVGDSGTIIDLKGDRDTQTIIATKYNDITERIDSLKLGSFIHSDLHQDRWDKIISGDSAAFRRLDVDEKKIKELDEKANYFVLKEG